MQFLRIYQKNRKKAFQFFSLLLLIFSYCSLQNEIPDTLQVRRGETVCFGSHLPVTAALQTETGSVSTLSTNTCGSYEMECRLFGLVPVKEVNVEIVEPEKVIACGLPVGICLNLEGVLVAETAQVEGTDGVSRSPSGHILKKGDYITAVNGKKIDQKEALVRAVRSCDGHKIQLTLLRNGEMISCELAPMLSKEGVYQLGIWVRDDMAGIGTLTYMDAQGNYGALGHGINDMVSENLACMKQGTLYPAEIVSVVKGKRGIPGELVGKIQYSQNQKLGTIEKNTGEGIYGTLIQIPESLTEAEAVDVGYKQEIENGKAEILIREDGTPRRYEIRINSVEQNATQKNKSIRFTVTDPKLIEKTGGIVQGLSGSPIIQDEKLIGAVTHVFVNNPQEGYGILAETMLEN